MDFSLLPAIYITGTWMRYRMWAVCFFNVLLRWLIHNSAEQGCSFIESAPYPLLLCLLHSVSMSDGSWWKFLQHLLPVSFKVFLCLCLSRLINKSSNTMWMYSTRNKEQCLWVWFDFFMQTVTRNYMFIRVAHEFMSRVIFVKMTELCSCSPRLVQF